MEKWGKSSDIEYNKNDFDNLSYYYKNNIYPGKSNSRNAIKLLQIIGFDEKVIKNANSLAELYTSTGTWHKTKRS